MKAVKNRINEILMDNCNIYGPKWPSTSEQLRVIVLSRSSVISKAATF